MKVTSEEPRKARTRRVDNGEPSQRGNPKAVADDDAAARTDRLVAATVSQSGLPDDRHGRTVEAGPRVARATGQQTDRRQRAGPLDLILRGASFFCVRSSKFFPGAPPH